MSKFCGKKKCCAVFCTTSAFIKCLTHKVIAYCDVCNVHVFGKFFHLCILLHTKLLYTRTIAYRRKTFFFFRNSKICVCLLKAQMQIYDIQRIVYLYEYIVVR